MNYLSHVYLDEITGGSGTPIVDIEALFGPLINRPA